MTVNSQLQEVSTRGWRRGLDNIMRAENHQWWRTKQWLIQVLIWTAVLAGLQALIIVDASSEGFVDAETQLMLFIVFAGLFVPVAVIIVMQDAIVGEKQTGTAAWVLSKPVSRAAFVLAKFFPNLLGLFATTLLIPSLFVFLLWWFNFPEPVQPLLFLLGLLVLLANLMFFQTLTLMLGAFFNHRAPVIGIPLAFLFMQQYIIGFFLPLQNILPYTLIMHLSDATQSVTYSVMTGAQPVSWLPLIFTVLWSLLFVILAVIRFTREEF